MKIIAHRGNLNGPNQRENHPDYIEEACLAGYEVEIDVWYIDHQFVLGHDYPQYVVEEVFLENHNLWCHAKDIHTAWVLSQNNLLHFFFHNQDDMTLTSQGYFWTYPGKELTLNSIAVLPERYPEIKLPSGIAGICTDFVHTKFI